VCDVGLVYEKRREFVGKEELPGPEAINDALVKAEFLVKHTQDVKFKTDPQTLKVLEDIALLVGSAKNMARHKNLAERLQIISEETKKALVEAAKAGLSVPSLRATNEAIAFVDTWRPLFKLLITSREFRDLCADLIKIIGQVFLRHHEGLGKLVEQKFLEGEPPKEIAKDAAKVSKESFQTPQGEVQVQISDEEFNQLNDDIARVLHNLSQHSTYHDGVQRFFNLLDLWHGQLKETRKDIKADAAPHARRAQLETEELVASFAGREAFDNFKESLKRLIEHVEEDERAKKFLRETRDFILDTKNGELNEEELKQKSRELVSSGRELVQEFKYRYELDDFFDRTQELFDNIQKDEFVSVLRHHAGIIAEDISFVDTEGRNQIDFEMVGKLRDVVVPVLAETFKYIPVPRIERSDKNRAYWVDNIVLCGYDVLPDNVRFQIESDSEVSIRDIETKTSNTRLVITLSKIRTELKNLDFFYEKKTVPTLTEGGRVTLRLGGDGATLSFIFEVQQNKEDKVPRLVEGEVHFNIHQLDIEFDKESLKYDVLVPIVTTMFKHGNSMRTKVASPTMSRIWG